MLLRLCINRTSFCLLAAKASSSSIRSLPAVSSSSSLSDFICCTKPNPMHLKGEPEPLGLEPVFSNLLDEFVLCGAELMLLVDDDPSNLTCSAMTSSALNCSPNYNVLKPIIYIDSLSFVKYHDLIN